MSLARKYDIIDSKSYHIPMEQNLRLETTPSEENNIKFRNIIGALIYISTEKKPDISYIVNCLRRFQSFCDDIQLQYALRILKYLNCTKDVKLTYQRNANKEMIDCYVNADWAGDATDRKSTTRYLIRMYRNIIYRKTRKQSGVTISHMQNIWHRPTTMTRPDLNCPDLGATLT